MSISINDKIKRRAYQYLLCMVGSILYAIGFNFFIVSVGLYSGGVFGISQLLNHFITTITGISFENINTVSIIYFILNVPLYLLAFKSMKFPFIIKTGFTVVFQSLTILLIPVPVTPIVSDVLTSCIVGGLLCGVGCGTILRAAASSGGMDIVGMYLAKKNPGYKLGRISLTVNVFILLTCALLFNIETAIYSAIYSVITNFTIDRFHIQNICSTAMIFTRDESLNKQIQCSLKRGTTVWYGKGGYTNDDISIIMLALSKYQKRHIQALLKQIDPHAFVIFTDGSEVQGNFERRLDDDE